MEEHEWFEIISQPLLVLYNRYELLNSKPTCNAEAVIQIDVELSPTKLLRTCQDGSITRWRTLNDVHVQLA